VYLSVAYNTAPFIIIYIISTIAVNKWVKVKTIFLRYFSNIGIAMANGIANSVILIKKIL